VDLLQALGVWLLIERIILAETVFVNLFHTLSNVFNYKILQYTKVFSWGLSTPSMDFLSNTPGRAIPLFIAYYSNIYPTRCNVTQFILSGNCSTCFGWYFTHHQKRKQLYLQHLVFVTPLLLSAAIVEETHSTLKPVPTLPR
jgi:hypothetical protein